MQKTKLLSIIVDDEKKLYGDAFLEKHRVIFFFFFNIIKNKNVLHKMTNLSNIYEFLTKITYKKALVMLEICCMNEVRKVNKPIESTNVNW